MKKTRFSKLLCLALAFSMILVLSLSFTGCKSDSVNKEETVTQNTDTKQTEQAVEATGEAEPITLTYWIQLGEKASQVVNGNGEILAMQVLTENLGYNIEYLQPPIGQEQDQYNLMIASRDLPDMVFADTSNITDNLALFMPITNKIGEYAPSYNSIIQDPDIMKALTMDDGEIYTFSHLRLDPTIRVWMGPQIRGDWLDQVDMQVPTTIEEWYAVLTAFKNADLNGNGDPNDELPFVSRDNGGYTFFNFSSAWGLVTDSMFVKDGQIKYSPYEAAYKDFLTEMNKWFEEGLLDNDWPATDNDSYKAKISTNLAGAFFGSLVGVMGRFNELLQEDDPAHHLVGAPWVKSTIDGVAYNPRSDHATIVQPQAGAINAETELWKECMTFFDYHYSEEGHMLMNFGVEGVSYNMVDGYPTFSEEVTNNPDGLAFAEALAKYALSSNSLSPYVQDPRQFAQFSLGTEDQKEANEYWARGDQSLLIPNTTKTVEETEEYSEIMSEVYTYVSEMSTKFIMGLEPLSGFDDYISTLKKMNVERVIEIEQAAYDRYNSK